MPTANDADPGATRLPDGSPLTSADVAVVLGVTAPHVRTLIGSGELKAINIARHDAQRPQWRIAPEEVRRFRDRRTNESPAPRPPQGRQSLPDQQTLFD